MADSVHEVTEQAMPVKNDEVSIQDRVIADIERRKQIGLERYGMLLQPFNGRDAGRDAYEEALDLVQYLKQDRVEREAMVALLLRLRGWDGFDFAADGKYWRAEIDRIVRRPSVAADGTDAAAVRADEGDHRG